MCDHTNVRAAGAAGIKIKKAVTEDSPLKGESTVTLNVIPPNKSVPHERTVTKKVNGWNYIGQFVFRFK